MELLLVRHALPVRRELEEGAADPELSADGREQAEHVAQYLASETLHAVYASPLRRAVETAAPIAAAQNLEIAERTGIAEWDQASSEYIPIEELKAANDPRWQAIVSGEWDSDESEENFAARVIATIEEIVGQHRGERVAVVCHGGVINCYMSHVLGITETPMAFFYPNYTSIHRVAASGRGHRSLLTLNETSHLRGTGLPVGLFQAE